MNRRRPRAERNGERRRAVGARQRRRGEGTQLSRSQAQVGSSSNPAIAMSEEWEREGCAVGERDVNAYGAAEARYRSGAAAMPERGMNAATLLLLNS